MPVTPSSSAATATFHDPLESLEPLHFLSRSERLARGEKSRAPVLAPLLMNAVSGDEERGVGLPYWREAGDGAVVRGVVAYPEEGDEGQSSRLSCSSFGKLAGQTPGVSAQEKVG